MVKKNLLEGIATLVGFVIGAGILGIPYVVAKSGFITGLIDIIIIGLAIMMVNLYLGEVTLRTKGSHQLTGYAQKYLGKAGKKIMVFCMMVGLYGALVAYMIKEGEFLHAIFNPVFGGNTIIYSLLFFFLFSLFIYRGLKMIKKSELFMVFFMIIIVIILLIFSFRSINTGNLTLFDISKMYVPYGVILFAFLGTAAIPEVKEELKKNKKSLKKAIIIGSTTPIIIYIIFAFLVVGVTGNKTTDGAIIGLGNALGNIPLFLGLVLGVLTMATSFIAVGLALKEMYNFDFKKSKINSTLLTCSVPLVVFLIIILFTSIKNPFFRVLDITGVIAGGLTGILVILMFWKAKTLGSRKPEYEIKGTRIIGFILILVFALGIIYGLLKYSNLLII